MAPTTTGTAKNTRKEYPRRESQSAVYSNNDIDKDCNHRNTSSKAQIAAYLLIILAMAGGGGLKTPFFRGGGGGGGRLCVSFFLYAFSICAHRRILFGLHMTSNNSTLIAKYR